MGSVTRRHYCTVLVNAPTAGCIGFETAITVPLLSASGSWFVPAKYVSPSFVMESTAKVALCNDDGNPDLFI